MIHAASRGIEPSASEDAWQFEPVRERISVIETGAQVPKIMQSRSSRMRILAQRSGQRCRELRMGLECHVRRDLDKEEAVALAASNCLDQGSLIHCFDQVSDTLVDHIHFLGLPVRPWNALKTRHVCWRLG